ncbi:MAG: CBS domain-containing protein [Candidatus Aenigmarchaeota archaeon]|nr:CBS domain-containing protein [Candidatus Aenigmarchaeota archaeon]
MIFIDRVFSEKKISTVMQKNVITAEFGTKIIDVSKIIFKFGHRRIPIVKKSIVSKKTIGIVTIMDILDAYLRGVSFENKIEDIMTRDFIYCYNDDKVEDVIRKFQFSRRGGFPVLDQRKNLVGIVTENDVIGFINEDSLKNKVKYFMTKKPFYLKKQKMLESIKILVNTKYRKLPIVESNKIQGLLTDRICLKEVINNSDLQRYNTDFCIKDLIYVNPEDDIMKAINIMREKKLGGIPVVEKEKLVGIITERDILDKIKFT